jgi:hypothetical protein
LLVKGELRKRGGASLFHPTHPTNTGITVVVEDAFDLAELARDRADGMSLEEALEVQRARWMQTSDGRSAGGSPAPRSVLWHASGGSAGR